MKWQFSGEVEKLKAEAYLLRHKVRVCEGVGADQGVRGRAFLPSEAANKISDSPANAPRIHATRRAHKRV